MERYFVKFTNHATIYIYFVHSRAVSPSSPAGAVYSSSTDMAKWMLFHVHNGHNAHGHSLVNGTWLNETYESQMTLGSSELTSKDLYKPEYPVADVSVSYDFGWVTSTYRGTVKPVYNGLSQKTKNCFSRPIVA